MKSYTDEEKVAMFDALMSCERIRVVGMARGGAKGLDGEINHIGMEFWDKYKMTKEQFDKYDTRAPFLEFIEGLTKESK
jgi:hypothetical protein